MNQLLFALLFIGLCNTAALFAKAPTARHCFRTHYTPLIKLGTDLLPSASAATATTPQKEAKFDPSPVASVKLMFAKLLAADGEMKKINNNLQTSSTTNDNNLLVGGR